MDEGRRTIEYCTNENSCEICLFSEIERIWYFRGVGIIRPGHLRRVRHGLCLCNCNWGKGILRRVGRGGGGIRWGKDLRYREAGQQVI